MINSHPYDDVTKAAPPVEKARRAALWPAVRTALLAGLAWGLAFGLVDGLPALLEGDPLEALGRRLLALAFVAIWNAVAFALVAAVGAPLAAAILRLARRPVSGGAQSVFVVGLCALLSAAGYLALRFPAAPPLLVTALALPAGIAASIVAGRVAAVRARVGARPGKIGRALVAVWAAGLLALLAVALFRATARDWPLFNPRVTGQSPTAGHPNIVLVTVDALRADRLGIYGGDPAASPRIDALARQGVVFEQAVSLGSSTVPAIAALLTSLHPTELGLLPGRPWAVDDMRITLAEALQVAGYRTQAFIGNGHLVAAGGYAQGFDGYVPPVPGRAYNLDRLRAETVLWGLACRHSTPACRLLDAGYGLVFDPPLALEDEGARINRQARRFIRVHRDEQFFLWLHYMEPHAAYSPSRPLGSLPAAVDAGREAFLRSWQPSNTTAPAVIGPDDLLALRALYGGEIRDVDRLIGEIWDELAAQGLDGRTLLVITADHGDEFGDHGAYGHGHSVYRELTHVPLILAGPAVARPGRSVAAPVSMIDLMPTLLDIAGAPLPTEVRGKSLLPVLQGGEPAGASIVVESPARRAAQDDKALIRDGFKLVYHAQLDRAELYDLRADPTERHDLAAAEPERAVAMRAELRAWTAAALKTLAALPQAGVKAEEMDAAMEEALRRIGY